MIKVILGVRLRTRPLNFREVARTVDDTNDLSAIVDQAVQRQPAFDNQRSRVFRDFRTRRTDLRMLFQQLAVFFDAVVDPVGDRFGSVRRDI
jgi:hypothetical protein